MTVAACCSSHEPALGYGQGMLAGCIGQLLALKNKYESILSEGISKSGTRY